MARSSPLLPVYTSFSPWTSRAFLQFKIFNQKSGGGAARRVVAILLAVVLSTIITYIFILSTPLQQFCRVTAGPTHPGMYETGPNSVPSTHLYPLPPDATFEERITALRNAPGLGWEPADFVRWNLETCSNVIPNHNKDLLAKSSLIWGALNSTAIIQLRENMVRFLQKERDAGAFQHHHIAKGGKGLVGEGRGIVFTAGNADTLARVVITLKFIRKRYNCNLPAAIFHFPSERPPPDSTLVADLKGLNATLVEAKGRDKDSTRQKNYQLKAQSIVECEWAEVIYLDSDNLPAENPELLFDAPNYKRLGAFFTPDYWKTSASNPVWHIIGVQCRDEWEQEAGQIVIDKRRHLDAMLLSLYMLTDWKFWFYFSDGDKDVFRYSMLALRKRWALPGRYVGGGGLPRGTLSGDFCAHTMQQYDHAGRPFFIHYNLLKQIPSGVYLGFTWGRTKQVASFPTPPSPTRASSALLNATTAPERLVPYPDPVVRGADDVEADMLANSDDNGWTIYPGTDEVRRRAALERGIRPFFHGGGNTAFCIDMTWKDPASEDTPREKVMIEEGDEKKLVSPPNPLGIDWDRSPLEIAQWSDDERLRTFESDVYQLGFEPSGQGF